MINCTTEIVVDKLLWIDQERDITLASSSSSTMITLKFNPVNDSIHGKSFTCRAIQEMAMVDQHIKVNVSGKTSFNYYDYSCSLVCFVPTAPLGPFADATISYPQNNPAVGESYNLTCLYNIFKGFVAYQPTVLWMYPDQTNSTSSSIVFDVLLASNGGKYTCEVTLTSPVLNYPEVANQIYNLTIQRKPLINHHTKFMERFSTFSSCSKRFRK